MTTEGNSLFRGVRIKFFTLSTDNVSLLPMFKRWQWWVLGVRCGEGGWGRCSDSNAQLHSSNFCLAVNWQNSESRRGTKKKRKRKCERSRKSLIKNGGAFRCTTLASNWTSLENEGGAICLFICFSLQLSAAWTSPLLSLQGFHQLPLSAPRLLRFSIAFFLFCLMVPLVKGRKRKDEKKQTQGLLAFFSCHKL